jgi:putative flippase GtrA
VRDRAEVLRYCAVGALNTAFGFSVIIVCMSGLSMPPPAANAAGLIAGYFLGYALHRRFTFRSKVTHGRGLASFLAVTAIGYAANAAVLLGLLALGMAPVPAQGLAILSYVAITFFLNASFVFARR